MRVGIILAAGKASRLPNKWLLPLHKDMNKTYPVIEESIRFCFEKCDRTVVVSKESSPVWAFVNRYHPNIELVEQPKARIEVIGAIRTGLEVIHDADSYLITFGDNLYPQKEMVVPNSASVRDIQSIELDGWMPNNIDEGVWVGRDFNPPLKLAGWINLPKRQVQNFSGGHTLMHALNLARITPAVYPSEGWADIGSLESYKKSLER